MNVQLTFFTETKTPGRVYLPPVISRAMELGSTLAVSISGGKDSQAMLLALVELYREQGWTGELWAITADLGRIEWVGTMEHCYRMAAKAGIPLKVVKRPQGGMVDRWQQRMDSLAEKGKNQPGWSDSKNRYCTDHLKVQQIDKELRKIGDRPFWSDSGNRYCTSELKVAQVDKELRASSLVICAVGIRAQESSSRAQNARYCVRSRITTEAFKDNDSKNAAQQEAFADTVLDLWLAADMPGRLAFTWNAIFDWTLDQVWERCGTSDDDMARRATLYRAGDRRAALTNCPVHWAYATGNTRLSCSMCVLASKGDIENGAAHNPEVWAELVAMEEASGWTFRKDLALGSLEATVEALRPQLRSLYRLLAELDLIDPIPGLLLLTLLQMVDPELLIFWLENTRNDL